MSSGPIPDPLTDMEAAAASTHLVAVMLGTMLATGYNGQQQGDDGT